MNQSLHLRKNPTMFFAFMCILYALFTVEWNYYEERSLYGLLVLFAGYCVGIFSILKYITSSKPLIFSISIIYGLLLIFSICVSPTDGNKFQDIIKNSAWIIMFYMCYIWGARNFSFSNVTNAVNYIVLPAFYCIYIYILVGTLFSGSQWGFRDAIIPIGVLSPFPLFCKNSKIRNIHLIIIVFLALLSAKRSIILGIVLGLTAFFLKTYKDSKNKIKFIILLGMGVVAVLCVYQFGNLDIFSITFSRFDDMLNGISGGRDTIADELIKDYNNSDFNLQLWGHGSHATANVVGKLAHNDFLQVLYDYGCVPLIFFSIIYITLIMKGYYAFFKYNFSKRKCAIYCYTLITFIIFGMFNCFISSPQTFTISMSVFGYLIGQFQYYKSLRIQNVKSQV